MMEKKTRTGAERVARAYPNFDEETWRTYISYAVKSSCQPIIDICNDLRIKDRKPAQTEVDAWMVRRETFCFRG